MAPFSSKFEFLCSELSMINMRIKRWGESHGLHFEIDNLPATLTTTPELESTTTQCMATMINVLTEVEVIRQKYEYQRPTRPTISSMRDIKILDPSIEYCRCPVTRLVRRIRANQKQKSYATIAKWNMVDARKFEDKIGKLRTLIAGLECISAPVRQPRPLSPVVLTSVFPPYPSSKESAVSQSRLEQDTNRELMEESYDVVTECPFSDSKEESQYNKQNSLYTYFPTPTFNQDTDIEIEAHYAAMILHCGPTNKIHLSPRHLARERLYLLSDQQFEDLRIDIYDELSRRDQCLSGDCPPLPSSPHFDTNRNQAREKLANLDASLFKDLVTDLAFEMERRFPSLITPLSPSQPEPPSVHESPIFASCPRNSRPSTLRSTSANSVMQRRREPLFRSTSSDSISQTTTASLDSLSKRSLSLSQTQSQRQRSPPPPLQFRSPHPTTINTSASTSASTPRSGSLASEISVFEPDTPPTTPSTLCASPRTPTQAALLSPITPFSPKSHPNPLYSSPISPISPPSPQNQQQQNQSPPSPSPSSHSISSKTETVPEQVHEVSTQYPTQTFPFHMTPLSTTSQILPQALLKYNIPSAEGGYCLYVIWGEAGEKERKLEDGEFPLEVFSGLEVEGLRPGFLLRKKETVDGKEDEEMEDRDEGLWMGMGIKKGREEREDDGWRPCRIDETGAGFRQSAIGVGF